MIVGGGFGEIYIFLFQAFSFCLKPEERQGATCSGNGAKR